MLGHGLIELGARLRHLILYVFPADMCESNAFFRVVSGLDVTKPSIRSSNLQYIRDIAGRAKREVDLCSGNDGRGVAELVPAGLADLHGLHSDSQRLFGRYLLFVMTATQDCGGADGSTNSGTHHPVSALKHADHHIAHSRLRKPRSGSV